MNSGLAGTVAKNLSFRNIGAIYVWSGIIVFFCVYNPSLFPTVSTIRAVGNDYAISGLAALAVVVPLACGTFDASIGGTISLSAVICAWLLTNTHMPMAVVILFTLAVGIVIGLFNVVVVVRLKIPSIIGTLAVWLIADALSVAVSGNATISSPRVAGDFSNYFAAASWGGFTIPIAFMLVIMALLGVFLSQTASGRYVYAVGFDPHVSRLAGVRVGLVQALTLVWSGVIGAFTGIVLTATVSSATPAAGDAYLLPAFAAAFVGATQFRMKRFNAVGTVIAVLMLGTGQYGLLLSGAPQWTPNVFQGLALIAAISLTHLRSENRLRVRRRRRPQTGDESPAVAAAEPVRAGKQISADP